MTVTLAVCVTLFAAGWQADVPYDDVKSRYQTDESRWIDVAGAQVHYTDQGTGPVLVLLHGSGAELGAYAALAPELVDHGYRVITLDLPGSGLSQAGPETGFHNTDGVALVAAFLKAKGITPFALGGHSTGGQIAWTLALDHPQMIERLVLLAPTGQPTPSPLTWQIAQTPLLGPLLKDITPTFVVRMNLEDAMFDTANVTDAMVQRYTDMLLREGARDALLARMQNVTFDRVDELSEIAHPTLLVWGAEDAWLPAELAYVFDAALPRSSLILLPDVGHNLPEEVDATTLANALDAWLSDDPAFLPQMTAETIASAPQL